MLTKIALISDIQGNFTALQNVLPQIDAEAVEQTICLGDVACGAQPHQVVELLREQSVQVIKGNMDDVILNPRHHETDDPETLKYDDIDLWCSNQLTDLDKAYIRTFQYTATVALVDEKKLLCFHGSPYSYNSVIDETISEGDLKQILDGYTADIMATGHMHHPFLRKFGNSWIINPGSVGLPRKQNGRHPLYAEYAMIEILEGVVHIEFRQVRIDEDEFTEGIRNSGMPHAEWFLSQWDVAR